MSAECQHWCLVRNKGSSVILLETENRIRSGHCEKWLMIVRVLVVCNNPMHETILKQWNPRQLNNHFLWGPHYIMPSTETNMSHPWWDHPLRIKHEFMTIQHLCSVQDVPFYNPWKQTLHSDESSKPKWGSMEMTDKMQLTKWIGDQIAGNSRWELNLTSSRRTLDKN